MKKIFGKFYECVVKYDKTAENGMFKKFTETYCVMADNFADAEKRITEELQPYVEGEFEIKNITPAAYDEVFVNDKAGADTLFFKAKLEFIIIDETTMKEKKKSVNYLVLAEDFADSLLTIQDVMGSTPMDYVTAQISQSKVIELFEKDGN